MRLQIAIGIGSVFVFGYKSHFLHFKYNRLSSWHSNEHWVSAAASIFRHFWRMSSSLLFSSFFFFFLCSSFYFEYVSDYLLEWRNSDWKRDAWHTHKHTLLHESETTLLIIRRASHKLIARKREWKRERNELEVKNSRFTSGVWWFTGYSIQEYTR